MRLAQSFLQHVSFGDVLRDARDAVTSPVLSRTGKARSCTQRVEPSGSTILHSSWNRGPAPALSTRPPPRDRGPRGGSAPASSAVAVDLFRFQPPHLLVRRTNLRDAAPGYLCDPENLLHVLGKLAEPPITFTYWSFHVFPPLCVLQLLILRVSLSHRCSTSLAATTHTLRTEGRRRSASERDNRKAEKVAVVAVDDKTMEIVIHQQA